jgi:hypothetical protein
MQKLRRSAILDTAYKTRDLGSSALHMLSLCVWSVHSEHAQCCEIMLDLYMRDTGSAAIGRHEFVQCVYRQVMLSRMTVVMKNVGY